MFIVFRTRDGQWGTPVNIGTKINAGSYERFARLSSDQRYLFFASDRNKGPDWVGYDVYWIDAKIIDELRARD